LTSITFIEHNGKVHQVEAEDGTSAMRAASDNGIPGIFADCGGAMTCATCHVYLDPEWLEHVGAASEDEATMLEMAVDPQPNSRLACQIVIEERLRGLVLNIPSSQF
jgi:2Fe-2S ferredoxin